MKTIYLLRHEKCQGTGYIGGGSDVALTASGTKNAKLRAKDFRNVKLEAIFSSPMRRCVETASPIGEIKGLKPILKADLTELNFGLWEGRSYDEIASTSPALLTSWLNSPVNSCPPEGEKLSQLYDRVQNFWKTTIEKASESEILIVSHGGPIRSLLSILCGGGLDNHWAFSIERGNLCIIKMYDDLKCQITAVNLHQITE